MKFLKSETTSIKQKVVSAICSDETAVKDMCLVFIPCYAGLQQGAMCCV